MHPILSQARRLGIYLLAWIPIAGMLVYLLRTIANADWFSSAALVLPLCLIYAFVCLSAWYPCQATPLNRTTVMRFFLSHGVAALLLSAVWAGMAWLLAAGFSRLQVFRAAGAAGKILPLFFGAGILLYLLSVANHYVLIAIEESREAQQREIEASVLAREAELKALRAQVNPHFLFNSLHSISALTSRDAAAARQMCIALGDFLRNTLKFGDKPAVLLKDELALIGSFLAIEKVRLGARLKVDQEIAEDALEVGVPPLLLQPLVENAINHGIASIPEGGWLRLRARRAAAGESLSIVVENSFDPEAPAARSNGMGLKNVRQRLLAFYGERASVAVEREGEVFTVRVLLPAERVGDRS